MTKQQNSPVHDLEERTAKFGEAVICQIFSAIFRKAK